MVMIMKQQNFIRIFVLLHGFCLQEMNINPEHFGHTISSGFRANWSYDLPYKKGSDLEHWWDRFFLLVVYSDIPALETSENDI